jgi:hypothetical protein
VKEKMKGPSQDGENRKRETQYSALKTPDTNSKMNHERRFAASDLQYSNELGRNFSEKDFKKKPQDLASLQRYLQHDIHDHAGHGYSHPEPSEVERIMPVSVGKQNGELSFMSQQFLIGLFSSFFFSLLL